MPSTLLAPHAIEDYENNRTSLLASTGLSPKGLCDLDDQQLLQLQEQLLMGATWGMWEFPAKWGQAKWRTPGRRSYRLKLALPDDVDPQSEYGNRIWREVLRFTLALRLWPGPWGGLCKPGSIRTSVGVLGRIIRGLGASNEAPFWARIDRTVAREFGGKAGPTHTNILSFYHKMGALPDGPASTRRKGEQPRRDRSGEPEHTSSPESSRQWMPFPDTYTAAAGWRALCMLREVGPTLMDALERVAALPIRTSTAEGRPLIKSSVRVANKAQRDQVIAKWDWRSTDGTPLRSVPMKISMIGDGRRRHNISWPPETYADAMRLLYLVQASHLWVVALSLAGRHGEIAEMKVNCIRRETTTTPTGSFFTWKLEEVVGRESEAPLPSVVVFALQQQTRLAEIVRQTTGVVGDCLWVRASRGNSGNGGDPIFDLSSALLRFNSAFELGPLMENTNLHMHRLALRTIGDSLELFMVTTPLSENAY